MNKERIRSIELATLLEDAFREIMPDVFVLPIYNSCTEVELYEYVNRKTKEIVCMTHEQARKEGDWVLAGT